MMGVPESPSDVLACVEAGAAGYLPQEASLEDLRRSIHLIAAGEALCSPTIVSFRFLRLAQNAR